MTMLRMRTLLISLVLLGCGSDNKTTADAAVTLDCTTYCTKIAANCTGANAQFGGSSADDATAHCTATCAKFDVGTAADTSGATLGCHLYHAGAAAGGAANATTHCPHAGPAGAAVNAAAGVCGDPCTNFCATNLAVCGVMGTAATGQYASMGACMTACAGFDKTHLYTVDTTAFPAATPKGDSLACRLYHLTNAATSAANATIHCPHTQGPPTGPCAGAATP
jgi:hypothetical protein